MSNGGLLDKTTDARIKIDSAIIKITILAFVGTALSFLFSYFLKVFVFQEGMYFLLYSFLCCLGFLAFLFLQAFFVKRALAVNLIIFLQTAVFLIPFYKELSKFILFGALAAFLVFLLGIYTGRNELDNSLRIRFWRISKRVLPKAIIGVALFSSIIYAEFNIIEIKGFIISPTAFEKVVSPISRTGIFNKLIPEFDLSLSIDTLIENLAKKEVEKISEINALPDMIKNPLIDNAVKELEKKISEFVGFSVDPQEKASNVLYKFVMNKFISMPENIRNFAPAIVGIILFLTIVGLSFPIRALATILAFIIYQTLLVLDLSAVSMEGQSKEIVFLK
ncbi:hypothetical protein JW698_00315 [Candidatus Wolfebacteria bacterium]|nr:hypothetical protein [Candidatus Wolfebacteria bacterium]